MLDPAGVELIWNGGPEPMFANSGIPGTAEPVDGGYLLSGQWKIVSGIRAADWLVVVGLVPIDNQPAPDVRIFAVPSDQVQIRDSWDVGGMRATASNDVVGDRVFVPAELTVALDAPPHIDRPLYRGFIPTLVFPGCSAVALGVARRAIDETVSLVGTKPAMTGGTVADAPRAQYAIAKAQAAVTAAWLLLTHSAEALRGAGVRADAVTLDQRAALRAAMTHAAEVSRSALVAMYEVAGSAALYRSKPIERIFRDGMAVLQHANHSAQFLEAAGRVRLGLDPGMPLF
jgi:indole-3-acetate monooxygenase